MESQLTLEIEGLVTVMAIGISSNRAQEELEQLTSSRTFHQWRREYRSEEWLQLETVTKVTCQLT